MQRRKPKTGKAKSAADSFGSQVESESRKRTLRDAFAVQEQEDRPMIDEFDYDDELGGDSDDNAAEVTKKPSKRARLEAASSGKKKTKRLTLKGNLDSSLEEGKYAGTAVDAEKAMDDIFGFLEDDIENEAGTSKIKNQDEYEEWFEEQKEKEASTFTKNYVNDRDVDIVAQIEQLRLKQEQKVSGDIDLVAGKSVAGAAHDDLSEEELANETAHLAREYVDMATTLVQLRLKLQPAISSSIRLPQGEDVLEGFTRSNPKVGVFSKEVSQGLREVLGELLSASSHNKKEGADLDAAAGYYGGLSLAGLGKEVEASHRRIMRQADEVVTEWGKKAIATAGPVQRAKEGKEPSAQMQVINRPLIDQIKGILEGGKLRLLDKSRKNKKHAAVFGNPAHHFETPVQRALRIADGDLDAEIYDDVDFLRELVHRNASAQQRVRGADEQAMNADDEDIDGELRQAGKDGSSRVGLHRLTKGKSVNINPRPKIVGFMAPVPYSTDYGGASVMEGESIALLKSLFQ